MSRIVLIGAPGSGKSTVGSSLAHHLKLPFVDTDAFIEAQQGRKISNIFVDDGEGFFRAIEYEALLEVLQRPDCVVSLGGGAPISEKAQLLLRQSESVIFFLDVSLATAAPRVGFNRDRPLLLGNPRAQWQTLSDQRRPIYEDLADHVIKVDGMSVEEIVHQVEVLLK
jgi:shikimate kinase